MMHGDRLLEETRRLAGLPRDQAVQCPRCSRILRAGQIPALTVLCTRCSAEAEPDETGFPR